VVNETLQKLSSVQRINHFPAMSVISRKNTLALTLARMKEQFPLDYDFFPRTFLLPNDAPKLHHYFAEARRRGLAKTFIVKPEAGCQGRGIYLSQNPADLEKEERCVVQKYVANPLLYRGLKFDLRIYVLLACV
jgi:tubulin polyglutamylase TTLL6/13